ncbi:MULTISPECIES: hypothetical protein [Actinomyces]|uniref:Uncharacterized protein n=1 Tax=Actinomyces respiraculi TaxID=2744574 RepID=A0A7T0PW51_9ACTO|nr:MULTISPECIES: hypothetical protein [Actinomyces]QPL05379.1 hypothetical protein ID810_11890 [Actinomyces respiraculi]
MRIRRRSALLLGGLLALTPALVSCAVARDTRTVANYFTDRPRVRSVKDSFNTADAADQVIIDLELEEDVSADDVAALFADAEPVLREETTFPVYVTASWSHHGVRMDKCAQAVFNAPSASMVYDGNLLRAGVEGALTVATGTARTVGCGRITDRVDGEAPALSYTVDHGSADTLPDDVALTLPQDLARGGYDVLLEQKVVLADWEVSVAVTSREGAASAKGVPVDGLVAALPQPSRYSWLTVGDSPLLPEDVAIGVGMEVSDEDGLVSLGAAAVRALEKNGWHGIVRVRGTGGGTVRDVLLDTSTSPATVVSESETATGLGEQMREGARA